MVGGIMASFAELDDNNIVLRVISVSNDVCGEPTLTFPDTDAAGRAFIANTLKLAEHGSKLRTTATFVAHTQVSATPTTRPPTHSHHHQ